jgi:hypothetical protein
VRDKGGELVAGWLKRPETVSRFPRKGGWKSRISPGRENNASSLGGLGAT